MRTARILPWVQAALCVLLAALLALAALDIYAKGTARVREDPAASVYRAEDVAAHAGPPLGVGALGLGVTILSAALGIRGRERGKPAAMERGRQGWTDRKALRRVLLGAAVLLILTGVVNGSMNDVLVKAAKICTECIGLG